MKTLKISSPTSDSNRNFCQKCGRELTPEEIAITKKLINRGTSIYYCVDCLAEAFDVKEKI